MSYRDQLKETAHRLITGRKPISALAQTLLMVFQLLWALLMTPIGGLLRLAGYRFLMVDLSQIGSIMWVDLYLRERRLDGATSRRIFVCRSRFTDANTAALDLYARYFTYVSNPVMKLLLMPFFVNPWVRDETFRYDAPFSYGRRISEPASYGYMIHRKFLEAFDTTIVSFSDAQKSDAWRQLSPALQPGEKFVAVHARDSGFYQDIHRTTRNANIADYESAFRYLIEKGYKIVRLGDPAMAPIDEMRGRLGDNLIDYARSDMKSDLLDLFLVSEAAFYIGCASGMLALPLVFHTPSCFVNFYTASTCLGYLPGDVSTFKKIRYLSDDGLVPFSELMMPPLSDNAQIKDLERHGMYLEDSTEEEIFESVREMIEKRGEPVSDLQTRAKDMLPDSIHSRWGAGEFSRAIVELYADSIVSAGRSNP